MKGLNWIGIIFLLVNIVSSQSPPPEKGPTTISNPVAKTDSLPKSWFRFYGGLQLGFELMDYGPRPLFDKDLEDHVSHLLSQDSVANSLTDSTKSLSIRRGKVLQPYGKVLFAFPTGVFLGISIARNFDVLIGTQSILREQTGIIEHPLPDSILLIPGTDTLSTPLFDTISGGLSSETRKYGMMAHLGGLGIKFYVPLEFLSVKEETQLYASYMAYWNLGSGEIYSSGGAKDLNFHKSPIGMELSLGIQVRNWKYLSILGNLSFSKISIPRSFDWSDLITHSSSEDDLEWKSLKFNFQFVIHNDVFN